MMTISKFILYIQVIYRNLVLSVSSVDFYSDIRSRYTGYGFKYAFILCLFSSLLYCAMIFRDIYIIHSYFTHDKNQAVEYILSQIPDIAYNGSNISYNESPYFIYDAKGNKFAAVDIDGKISGQDRAKIPLILTSKNIIFFIDGFSDQKMNKFSSDYTTILGSTPMTITSEYVKNYCSAITKKSIRIFLYLIMPLLIVMRFIWICIEKSLAIFVLYVLANILNVQTDLRTTCRLVMFASGLSILLQPVINIFAPVLSSVGFLVQIIPYILVVASIAKAR